MREGKRLWDLSGKSQNDAKVEYEKALALAIKLGEDDGDVSGLIHRLMLFTRLNKTEGAKELVEDGVKKAAIEELEKRVKASDKVTAYEYYKTQNYLLNSVMGNERVEGEKDNGKVRQQYIRCTEDL